MIITRTPLRISFFGGGTDYPEWFDRQPGAVLGMAIDKYVYVTARKLSPIHPYRYLLYWSRIERCHAIEEITHPVVREGMKMCGVTDPMGLSIIADLPARNGLGSSSACAVGVLAALTGWPSINPSEQIRLAHSAINLERTTLRENGGWQDQILCSHGGLCRIEFAVRDGSCAVDAFSRDAKLTPIVMDYDARVALESSLFLIHTGDTRNSWEVNGEQIKRTKEGAIDELLRAQVTLVNSATAVLLAGGDSMLSEFGAMLHEAWSIKRGFSSKISNPTIDALYTEARDAGALGGKLCGAGGGGFLCVLVPPERQAGFLDRMRGVEIIRVRMDHEGTKIIHNEPERF